MHLTRNEKVACSSQVTSSKIPNAVSIRDFGICIRNGVEKNVAKRYYYEAYDDRYKQVHEQKLCWFAMEPTKIVLQIINRYAVSKENALLEIGCGEGRDANYLLEKGYDLTAVDVSREAIDHCRRENPKHASCFRVLDCVKGTIERKFDFIFAVAVIHMLVEDEDRNGFYRFIRDSLSGKGIALICSMGDGKLESGSDITKAFALEKRIHESSGIELQIARTSYRAVSFDTFLGELDRNSLAVLEHGITREEPDYPQMMYAVVKASE